MLPAATLLLPYFEVDVFGPLTTLFTSGDLGGWFSFNLDNTSGKTRRSQNWVVPMLFAEGRYSVAFDATALANGCSP